VVDGVTGVLFHERTPKSLGAAIVRVEVSGSIRPRSDATPSDST
jgi:hypothetical protein